MFLSVYLIICYTVALTIMLMTFTEEGKITINDLLMFVIAPFSVVPVILIHLLSHLVELDTVVFKR